MRLECEAGDKEQKMKLGEREKQEQGRGDRNEMWQVLKLQNQIPMALGSVCLDIR